MAIAPHTRAWLTQNLQALVAAGSCAFIKLLTQMGHCVQGLQPLVPKDMAGHHEL